MAERNEWPHGFGNSPAVIDLGADMGVVVTRRDDGEIEIGVRFDWAKPTYETCVALSKEQAYELANVLIVLSGGERMQT